MQFFHFPLNFTAHRRIHGNVREVYRETRTKESAVPIVKKPYIVFKASEREHVEAVAFQTLGYGNFKFTMHYQKYPQILTKNLNKNKFRGFVHRLIKIFLDFETTRVLQLDIS